MPIVIREKKKDLPEAPVMPPQAKAKRKKRSFMEDKTDNPANYKMGGGMVDYKYGGGKMGVDPVYKGHGGNIHNNR